jgi:hypothetical protein
MGVRPLAAADRAEPTRVPRPRPLPITEPRLRVFRKCSCGGGASCKCSEEAQASPDRETVAMLARYAGNSAVAGLVQRDDTTTKAKPKASKLDDKAAAIVKKAQDTSVDESTRGVEAVNSIVSTYFAGDAGLVKDVIWKKGQSGLNTESIGKGKEYQGRITVGHSFLQQTTENGFARRVIQVDHELEHVRQHRGGMTGEKQQDEREFLAFQREALEPEFPGTGRIAHATRVDVIDGALGYLYCLTKGQQEKYADKKKALLEEREKHNGKAGNAKTDPPTTCKRAND